MMMPPQSPVLCVTGEGTILMTMQSSNMHEIPRRRLTRTNSIDVPNAPSPSHSLKKRLSRTDSSMSVLSTDPLRYSLNISKETAPPRIIANRGMLTRSTTITSGMLLPSCNVLTPPIKVESVSGHPRRLVKQKTFSAPKYKEISVPVEKVEDNDVPMSTSCPNLADEELVLPTPQKTPVRHSKSSDGRLGGNSRQDVPSNASLLTVPSIFTTSHTRSRPDSPNTVVRGSYRHSAPELASSPTSNHEAKLKRKSSLVKSLSDTPPRLSHSQEMLSCDADPTQPRYARVLEYLYIGNNEAMDNERLMCRLGINSIINLADSVKTKEEPNTGSTIYSRWPCPCGSETKHLKATLRLQVSDIDTTEFESYMDQINKFIEGARKANKKVLVQCVTGNSLSVVAVMQYLMACRHMNLRKAYSMVMKTMSDLYIPPMYKDMLQRQEKLLLSPEEQSLCFDSNTECGPVPMEAWTSSPTPPSSPSEFF